MPESNIDKIKEMNKKLNHPPPIRMKLLEFLQVVFGAIIELSDKLDAIQKNSQPQKAFLSGSIPFHIREEI